MTDPVGDGVRELTHAERIRLRAADSDVAAMGEAPRNGTATPDDVEAALARSRALDIDPATLRNVLQVQSDAGPHAGAIEAILRRIPDGWGHWLNVDAGWYPLVVTTD